MLISEGVRAARKLHRQYVAKSPLCILETVAARDGVSIDRYPLDKSVAGLMLYISGKPVVALNSAHPDERQLFTLAHELGHVLLGHHAGWLTTASPLPDDPADEREANAFAAEFLMPAKRVASWAAQGLSFDQLCRNCQVSHEAMCRRLQELGLGRVFVSEHSARDCDRSEAERRGAEPLRYRRRTRRDGEEDRPTAGRS